MNQTAFRRTLAWGLPLLVVIAPLAAQDWAGKARVSGKVEDMDGNPVVGATITLRQDPNDPNSGPEPFQTKKGGRWSFLGLDGGNWGIRIEADGYLPSDGSFVANPFQPLVIPAITLERNPSATVDEGDTLMEAHDYDAALAKYLEALPALDGEGKARVGIRIGNAYLQQGDYPAARSEYQQALQGLEPADERYYIHLQIGTTYQLEGNHQAARAAWEEAMPLADDAGQVDLLMRIGKSYDTEGNRNGAIDTLKRALEITPADENLIQIAADLMMREGLEDEAWEYLERLPEGTILPADMVLNLGIRFYNEGKMTEAKEYFDQAVAENPDLADAYYYRGLIYLNLENNDQALADFRKLLEIDPSNEHQTEVKEFMEFLETGG